LLRIGQGVLADRTLTFGGQQQSGAPNQDYESHRVLSATNVVHESWGTTPSFLWSGPTPTSFPLFWDFPRMSLLSSGASFLSGKTWSSARMTHNPNSNTMWNEWAFGPPTAGSWSSSLLMPNLAQRYDWVMRVCRTDTGAFSQRLAEICNAAAPNITWDAATLPPLNIPRNFPSAVILPDASVFVCNGEFNAMPRPELLRLRDLGLPGLQWMFGQDSTSFGGSRDYHSGAVLLPDGRIFVMGGETRNWDYAIFRPYYLSLSERPVILSAPMQMRYQSSGLNYSFVVSDNGFKSASKIVLMRPCMSTHHSDMEQRYVELQTLGNNETQNGIELVVAPPISENHAPLGYYMAFAVTDLGVPSVAVWVQLIP
jgi:hypothetical protein